jgi:outer membrane protein assembly factor BamE (lipoprotein component of BamABCDE complex)
MSKNINNISLGMTKTQVMNVMGEPSSVSAIHGTEYMTYVLCTKTGTLMQDYRCVRWEDFYVRINQGTVESYGRKGDFDSTKVPENKHTLDVNIKQN